MSQIPGPRVDYNRLSLMTRSGFEIDPSIYSSQMKTYAQNINGSETNEIIDIDILYN